MGQEISHIGFQPADFRHFESRLDQETKYLQQLASNGEFDDENFVAGFELEAWLLDHAGYPNPINEVFLARLADPLVVRELSRFNVELNAPPVKMGAGALAAMQASLATTWQRCQEVAHGMDAALTMVGILPNLRPTDLCVDNMSAMKRFEALNREVQKQRGGEPIHIHIDGPERLEINQPDVMLEAATTSFQVHLQIPFSHANRFYNASLLTCGPLLAVAANSPLLFGHRLWHETRVPLFEQSVELGGFSGLADKSVRRVSFGQGYVGRDITSLFQENQTHYPVLLPMLQTRGREHFDHLRLHNGTIWRWVRPLIGHDDLGLMHVRLEQRILPSGPSTLDMISNAALYFGLAHALARLKQAPEECLSFTHARNNFYRAAREGLEVELQWLDGKTYPARDLLLNICLPMAEEGLNALGVEESEADQYLRVIRERVRSGQTGAVWQLANFSRERGDAVRMMANYLENQRSGLPVHEWNP